MFPVSTFSAARLAALAAAVALLCCGSAAQAAGHLPGRNAYVRVNQVGYTAAASKRAYLVTTGDAAGASFAVELAGSPVYTAPIGRRLGRWSARLPNVYALDFPTSVPGTYTIEVSGPVTARSPSFAIGAGVYDQAIANARTFYRDSRDGPDYILGPLRSAPGHLNDRHAMTYRTPAVNGDGNFAGDLTPLGARIDASGGWWDAGDYLKFVQTESYTSAVLLSGVRDFPAQMGAGSGADFTGEARFGVQWLLRMWNDRSRTLYYQVGIGSGNDRFWGDHDIWRLPQADDSYGGSDPRFKYIRHRPVFRAGPAGSPISPNLAGRDAAAFAECFVVFRTARPALADRCLTSAEHIFDQADTTPGRLLTVIPYDFYPETSWRDDLEWGATELSIALAAGGLPSGLPHTNPSFYLGKAAHWAHAYMNSADDSGDTLNLYDTSGLAHYDLYRAIGEAGNPAGLATTQAALLADMRAQLNSAKRQGASDPFRFGFPWAAFDTASHGFGLSVMASEYDQLSGTSSFANQSSRWLANVLGANAWGVSLAVGDGSRFPNCMQHQVTNLIGSRNGGPPLLLGAVVEGPNRTKSSGLVDGMRRCPPGGGDPYRPFNSLAHFKDNVQSWSTVEPAADLTATSPLAFARLAAGLN